VRDPRRSFAPYQPWLAMAGFAFLLNFVWEMLQAPFYTGVPDAMHWSETVRCARATVGDVGIALAGYAAGALAARNRVWIGQPSPRARAAYLATGLALTSLFEVYSVRVAARWAYSPSMPTVLGIGLLPMAQWVVLPFLVVWLTRRHLCV
jgi:hypothetical protein